MACKDCKDTGKSMNAFGEEIPCLCNLDGFNGKWFDGYKDREDAKKEQPVQIRRTIVDYFEGTTTATVNKEVR